jgi:hypothetical protein
LESPEMGTGPSESGLHFIGDAKPARRPDVTVGASFRYPSGKTTEPPTPWMDSAMNPAPRPGVANWIRF